MIQVILRACFEWLFLLNLFIMIYKFKCNQSVIDTLEVECENDLVVFTTTVYEGGTTNFFMDKEDVYKMIGALHLLHKEMK